MQNNTFRYRYSAAQAEEARKIREKYIPKQENKLERLRRLDARVSRAGQTWGLSLGIGGCLTFGAGLCFALGALGGGMLPSVLLCTLGVLLMLPAYPVARLVSKRTKERLSGEILRLSEELIKKNTD